MKARNEEKALACYRADLKYAAEQCVSAKHSTSDSGSVVSFIATTTPPAPLHGALEPNTVLKADFTVASYSVVIHGFENTDLNTWVSQDWSAYDGISIWLYGGNTGMDLFVDVIDNRNTPALPRDDAERFTVSFKDNFSGWQRISMPFSAFQRSDDQPAGAPNDGLTLASAWGYSFTSPGNIPTPAMIDQVKVQPYCSFDITVMNTADRGKGSLRQAISDVCFDGPIGVDPGLAGQTIGLTSGELTVNKPLTIDGSSAPGLSISASGMVRPFVIDLTMNAVIRIVRITNGYGYQLAGGILNNGTLTLDHVVVENNNVITDYEAWWIDGAGIYNGAGSTLTLVNSTVAGNTVQASHGGGVNAFFNTLVMLDRSTVSGNSAKYGGGLRTLGNVEIVNWTISGNYSYDWHGSALFHTNGAVDIFNLTIANNRGPDWASSALFIGAFDAEVPSLKPTNTIISGNQGYACDHWTGSVIVVSGGYNLVEDATCNPDATDLVLDSAEIGPMANNGGPTWTHALLPGSPALDAADDLKCPAMDQRGVVRPQGPHCDIGAYEALVP